MHEMQKKIILVDSCLWAGNVWHFACTGLCCVDDLVHTVCVIQSICSIDNWVLICAYHTKKKKIVPRQLCKWEMGQQIILLLLFDSGRGRNAVWYFFIITHLDWRTLFYNASKHQKNTKIPAVLELHNCSATQKFWLSLLIAIQFGHRIVCNC